MFVVLVRYAAAGVFFIFLWSCSFQEVQTPNVQHVVVIGVDGMSPDGILKSNTPVLDELMKEGAYTFQARSVLPSSSSSNWASMIMGADTEQHGITSNGWEPDSHTLPAVVQGNGPGFPTIFTLLANQRPDAVAGAVYDWDGFGRLFHKADVDFDIDGDHEDDTLEKAIGIILEKQPDLTFVHLDHVDHAGHTFGHGSTEYYESVSKADSLIGKLVEAVRDTEGMENTLFVVSADHGGVGTGHGGESPAEMQIPFILYGKAVKKGYVIQETVYQFDNAATVAFALGLKQPQAWIGRPVKGAFIGFDAPELRYTSPQLLPAPVILPTAKGFAPAGGLFVDTLVTLQIVNPNGTEEVRYTLDGTTPTSTTGFVYEEPIVLANSAQVKTILFQEGNPVSAESEAFFRYVSAEEGNGVHVEVFQQDEMERLPNFDSLKPVSLGMVYEFGSSLLDTLTRQEHVAIRLTTNIRIESGGNYTFYLRSDDGSRLFIDDSEIIDNDGDHGVLERSGALVLNPGWHTFRVDYFNGGGGHYLDVWVKGPKITKQPLPPHWLFLNRN